MRDNVLSLRVVLADGAVVKTGQRARKTSAGYDLTHLFIGSEGTLGVVTQITLRLRRIPTLTIAALCYFPSVTDAANSVMEMIQRDMIIGMVEFLDEMMMKANNKHYNFNYEEKPTLYFEFSAGSKLQLDEQEGIVREICTKFGGSSFVFSKSEKERQELFRARKGALFASKELRPSAEIWTTDVCVPISRLAECITETKKDLAKSFLFAPLVGHVGDGNFHLFILLDPKDEKDLKEANRINDNLVNRAIDMDGTCTGEHGVGIGKRSHLVHELGAEAVELMRRLKATLDPKGIFNPGKVLPPLGPSQDDGHARAKL
jgi:D-lactate dehydrogenase (cytochrome)